ncbi:MAG: amidase [Rhodospirillaceae bacterium]|nr:amidase [Rhodospirillaceae bacterium]
MKISGTAQDAVDAALRLADQPAARNVFTSRADARARAEAAAADATAERPPYRGVPTCIKDNVDIVGEVTTAGTKILAKNPPAAKDAPIAARLKRAGFINLGRTNMTEFAFAAVGTNPHYGTPRNPAFIDDRIPGGSSSGAAVAVALGIVPAAIGSDTGGSVRIPAALCGITGFKPTFGTITNQGTYPLAASVDTLGVLARSVADCAAMFDVIRDQPGAGRPQVPSRARLAVIGNYVRKGLDGAVAAAVDAACALLSDAGLELVPLDLPEIDEIPELHKNGTMVMFEGYQALKDIVPGHEAECDPRIVARILAGGKITQDTYAAIMRRRAELQASVAQRLANYDAYLMPATAITAPLIASVQDQDAFLATNALLLRNATVGNFMGHCAISLPCQPRGGAPVGLSLSMTGGKDDALLALAESAERILERRK